MSLQVYNALLPFVSPGDLKKQVREIREAFSSFHPFAHVSQKVFDMVLGGFHESMRPCLDGVKDHYLPGVVRPIESFLESGSQRGPNDVNRYMERVAHLFMEGAIDAQGLTWEGNRPLITGMMELVHPQGYTPITQGAQKTVNEWLNMQVSEWVDFIDPHGTRRKNFFRNFMCDSTHLTEFLRESTPGILKPVLEEKLTAFRRCAASYHTDLTLCDDVTLQLLFEPTEEHLVAYLRSRSLPCTDVQVATPIDLAGLGSSLINKRAEEGPEVRVYYHAVLDESGKVSCQPHFYAIPMGEFTIQITPAKNECNLIFHDKRDADGLPSFHAGRIYCDRASYVVRYLEALSSCRVSFAHDLRAKALNSVSICTHTNLAMGLVVNKCLDEIPPVDGEFYGEDLFRVIDGRLQKMHGDFLGRLAINEARRPTLVRDRSELVRDRLSGFPKSRGDLFRRILVGISYFDSAWVALKEDERSVLSKDQELRQFLHWLMDPNHPGNPKQLKENVGVRIYVDDRRGYHEAFDKLWRSLNGSLSPMNSDYQYPFEAVTRDRIPTHVRGDADRGKIGDIRDALAGEHKLVVLRELDYSRKEVLDVPVLVGRVKRILPEIVSYTLSQLQFELPVSHESQCEGSEFRLTPASYRDTLLALGEEVNEVAQALKTLGGSHAALDTALEALGFAPPRRTTFSMGFSSGSEMRVRGSDYFTAPSTFASDTHVRSQANVDRKKLDQFLNFLRSHDPYNQVIVTDTQEPLVEYFNRLLRIIDHAARGDYASEHAAALVSDLVGQGRTVTEHHSLTTFWNSFWGGRWTDTLVSTSERKLILGLDGYRHWTAKARFELRSQIGSFDITTQAEPPRQTMTVSTSRRHGSGKYTIMTGAGQFRLVRA